MIQFFTKSKIANCLKLLLFFCIFGQFNNLNASHMMGGSITYTWVSGNTYKVRVVMYRDCDGITPATSVSLDITNSCGLTNPSVSLPQIAGSPFNQTPVCGSATTTCTGGTNFGFTTYIYEANVVLPGTCSDWRFSYDESSRNDAITNHDPIDGYYNETVLNNTTAPNNAAIWTNTIPSFLCLGQSFTFNAGAHDVDGDSLFFDLVDPMDYGGLPINWNAGFSATNPFTASTFTLNPFTGEVTIVPTAIQIGNFCVRVREYRNGVLVGTSFRDIQFIVRNCGTNDLNTSEGIRVGGTLTTNPFTINCAQGLVTFTINAKDVDAADVLSMTWDNAFAGPTFTTSGTGGAGGITGTFSWNVPVGTSGIRILTFTVKDNFCPYPGVKVYTVKLEFAPVNAGPDVGYCGGAGVQLSAIGGDAWTWSPAAGLSCTNCQSPIATPASTTIYTVTNNCGATDQVTVTVPGIFTLSGTAGSTICAGQSLPLVVTPNPAAGAYTYSWSPTTGLSNPAIANPTATPTGTTNYVCTVTKGGCSRTFSVTVTVQAAPTVTVTSVPGNNLCVGQNTVLTAAAYMAPTSCGINMAACTGVTNNYTVGTASTTTSYPFNGLWHDARSQMIFTKTELNAAGIFGGRIDRLQFDVTTKNSTQAYSGFTIKMGCTAQSSYSGTTLLTGLATVYSANYTTSAGNNNLVLTSPYDWDGNTNLVVEFCFNNTSYTSSDNVAATTLGSTQTLYDYADSDVGCTLNSMTSSTTRPDIKFRVCSSNVGLTYLWSPATGLSSTTTATTTATPAVTTTYNVRVSEPSGCFRDVPVTVNVGPVFTLAMTAPVSICLGSSTNLNATPSAAGTYTYSWSPTTGLSNSAIKNPVANPTTTTVYTCTATNAGGCSISNTVTVTVTTTGAPVVTASGTPSSVCAGSNVNFTSAVTNNCTGYTMSNITYSAPAGAGYTAIASGDDNQATVAIPFTFKYYCTDFTSVSICTNGYIQFGGTSTTGANTTIPNPGTPNNIVALAWDDLESTTTGAVRYKTIGTAPNRVFVVNYNNISHYLSTTNKVTGFILLYETTNVIELHSTTVQNDGGDLTQGIEDGTGANAIAVTGRNAAVWTATNDAYRFTPNTPPSFTITWTDPSLNTIGSTANLTYAPTVSGNYTVNYADATGCTGQAIVPITVNSVNAGSDVSICPGNSTQLNANTTSAPASLIKDYIFTSTTGSLAATSGTITNLIASSSDDVVSSNSTIGFNFVFNGVTYTNFTAASDGWIKLGTGGSSDFTNDVVETTNLPKLYPYWDDLATGTDGSVRSWITGTAPNQILVVEWFVTIPRNTTGAANSTFQVWLYENGGKIEYHYGAMGPSVAMSSSVGATESATNYLSTTISSNTSSNSVANNANTGVPTNGTVYSYNPVPATYSWSPATGLSATNIANPIATPSVTTTYTVTTTYNGCTVSDPIVVTITPPTALVWNGSVSSDWFNSGNWDLNCVPGCGTTVLIPDVSPRPFPIVSGAAAAYSGDLTIDLGASISLNTNDFFACGHFINNGIFDPGTRRLSFVGTAPQNYFSNSVLYNVTLNNTAAGNNAYVNLLSNMELDNNAVLTFTLGRIVTSTFKVFINNNAAAAIVGYNVNRYIQGNLFRAVTGTRSYDFPVGLAPTGLGYQLANITFTVAPTFTSLNAYFIDYASTSTPSVSLTDCARTYDCIRTNHGKWVIDPSTAGTSTYNMTLYPLNGSVSCTETNWTIMKQPTGGAGTWAIQGTTCTNGANPYRAGLTTFSEFTGVTDLIVLPVELLSFTANVEGKNDGRIKWNTTNEVDNNGFFLQRSSDATQFTDIHFEQAKNGATNQYTFLDPNLANGNYYYRLKQVDNDGNTNYSEVKQLTISDQNFSIIAPYPNPTNGNSTLDINLGENSKVEVNILNALGQNILNVTNSEMNAGTHKVDLNTSKLAVGMYFVKVKVGANTQTFKLQIVE